MLRHVTDRGVSTHTYQTHGRLPDDNCSDEIFVKYRYALGDVLGDVNSIHVY